MPSWWKSSSKEAKSKTTKESFIDSLQKKFKSPESKSSSRSGGSRRRTTDTVSEKGSQSQVQSRSPSPSKHVARCQSFAERAQAQPLPLPSRRPANISRSDSGISESAKPKLEKVSKSSFFRPFPRPSCIRQRPELTDLNSESAVASIFSEGSDESDDPTDSRQHSPLANDYDNACRKALGNPSSNLVKDLSIIAPVRPKELPTSINLSSNKNVPASPPRRRHLKGQVPNLQVPPHGAFFSAPDSSMSSPSRSPMRIPGYEQVTTNGFTTGKIYPDFPFLGSGQCSSPGSGQTSGHNSMGGDMSGQLFWQPSRGSPEYSPNPSPRMTSPGPSSRIHSGAVTPLHPRAAGGHSESQSNWPDDAKQQSHRLPLPPLVISNSPFSHQNSAATSPSVPRSPGRADNLPSPGSRWKKGKLLGRGTFGHVYVGFKSETGEMCAMKEVTLFADDPKSKESAKQLAQEIALLSRLRHPNIVQYYGSETVDDKLYIYLEYVSGGSIHKILQEYGKLGESAIRSYTQQILSGLAYLHNKNTVHRDIKGANILVDPHGRVVKLADFGMAKHITGQSCPLSFKGSPYWMAPEIIKNSNGCTLAVDIWSLGCTVLEMATSKPPWSQYEGVAAMFKIGNSKELPTIPHDLSDEGKEFVRLCLQRNPLNRPTAAQLLEHPFVKSAAPLEKQMSSYPSSDHPAVLNAVKSGGIGNTRIPQQLDTERLAIHSSRVSKSNFHSSDIYMSRNISCPVSPVGSPLLYPRSPQHLSGRMSPSPISSPRATSGSSTPLTGGIGAIPFHSQPMLSPEGLGNLQMRPCSPPTNTISYWDPDLLRGIPSGSNAFRELTTYENDAFGKQFGRAATGELYEGQLVSADRVSQQLLRDPVKLNPSLDLSPSSPLASHRMTGI